MDHQLPRFSAVFLDRDGVINKRIPDDYVKNPEEFEFLPEVPNAIALFSKMSQYVFVVTNQQGIGRELMTEKQLHQVHDKMLKGIEAAGGRIDKIYFCPHRAKDRCKCRKPLNGMFQQAIIDFPEIKQDSSLMFGDTLNDMIFGRNSGLKTILIGSEIQIEKQILKNTDMQFGSLFEAAKHFM